MTAPPIGCGENYAAGDSWVDLGTYAGEDGEDALYGFFYKVDVKSLVWYSPEQFEEAGYDIPETMEELRELTQQIADDGAHPVVHRPRFGCRHRLAGNRLGRGPDAAPACAGGL